MNYKTIKKIDIDWLNNNNTCEEGCEWFKNQTETDVVIIAKKLINNNKLDWCNWLITKTMTPIQQIQYAVHAAAQVIDIFEKQFPDDPRPREAIETAKNYLENPSKKNRDVARDAARAARATASAAWAARDVAGDVAEDAAWAARATARAAWAARDVAGDVAEDAAWAARATASAAWAARDVAGVEMKNKILNFGIKLLMENAEFLAQKLFNNIA